MLHEPVQEKVDLHKREEVESAYLPEEEVEEERVQRKGVPTRRISLLPIVAVDSAAIVPIVPTRVTDTMLGTPSKSLGTAGGSESLSMVPSTQLILPRTYGGCVCWPE